jgi:hypothetical protein
MGFSWFLVVLNVPGSKMQFSGLKQVLPEAGKQRVSISVGINSSFSYQEAARLKISWYVRVT